MTGVYAIALDQMQMWVHLSLNQGQMQKPHDVWFTDWRIGCLVNWI